MKYIYKYFLGLLILNIIFSVPAFSKYWKQVELPVGYENTHYLDVFFLESDNNFGWICGFDGHILRTINGGDTWWGSTVPGGGHLESIHFLTTNIGYTSGVNGIFKSTDGGITWANVTPDPNHRYWGCFFINENVGLTVGEGCSTGIQYFWRTTDGGNTWDVFVGNEPNSGLTDVMLFSENGVGYASSSGLVWRTDNGGVTWAVYMETGVNVWHEEITNYGTSILVPFAGTSCEGLGDAGGAIFYSGGNWRQTSFGRPMFGTFLESTTTGWCVGDNEGVFYTQDAGRTWDLRNCGIEDGRNMDDIWIIDENKGWVVGQGVYELANPMQVVDIDSIDFGTICIPGSGLEEFSIRHISFFPADAQIYIYGENDDEFDIITPTKNDFILNECDSQIVQVEFTPKTAGTKTAYIQITVDYKTFRIDLTAEATEMVSEPETYSLNFDSVLCGKSKIDTIFWFAETDGDIIETVKIDSGSYVFSNLTSCPMNVYAGSSNLNIYEFEPKDTGWVKAIYAVHVLPCDIDVMIELEGYGVSPVIDSDKEIDFNIECAYEKIDTIPVYNTGNADLVISSIYVDKSSGFEYYGWVGNSSIPRTIKPGGVDSVIIKFTPPDNDPHTANLVIRNNDKTTLQGEKDPYYIELSGSILSTNLLPKDTLIDFGTICIFDTLHNGFYLRNAGNLGAFIERPEFESDPWLVKPDKYYPFTLDMYDSVYYDVRFTPVETGEYYDTLIISSTPCDDSVRVILKANVIESDISVSPENISMTVQTKTPTKIRISVTSDSDTELSITEISFTPMGPQWDYVISPALPVPIQPGETLDFDLTFTFEIDTIIEGNICVRADGLCPAEECITHKLQSHSRWLITSGDIDFGFHRCYEVLDDTLTITNTGTLPDTIKNIIINPDDEQIGIINMPAADYVLESGESISLFVQYNALNELSNQAVIEIRTRNEYLYDTLLVNVKGEYRTVKTNPLDTLIDFGIIEQCDIDRDSIITYTNSGLYNDTLLISQDKDVNGFAISPADTLFVNAGESADITLYCNPGEFDATGEYDTRYYLSSIVCDNTHILDRKAEIIRPMLTVTPDSLYFGDIWVSETNELIIRVENNSDYPKTVSRFELAPDNVNYSHDFDETLPYTFMPGDYKDIKVTFTAPAEASYLSYAIIEEKSICVDTTNIALYTTVPEEHYPADLWVEHYEGGPGDTLTVPVYFRHREENFQHDLSRISPDSIYMKLDFNRRIFQPKGLFVKNGTDREQLNYVEDIESISVGIPGKYAANLLEESGELLWMNGYFLVNIPQETPLEIANFDLINYDKMQLTKEDGSLKVTGFCYPVGEQRLDFIPKLSLGINNNVVQGGYLNLKTESESERQLQCIISDVIGNKHIETLISVDESSIESMLDIGNLPNGMYFITVMYDYQSTWTDKFIINR